MKNTQNEMPTKATAIRELRSTESKSEIRNQNPNPAYNGGANTGGANNDTGGANTGGANTGDANNDTGGANTGGANNGGANTGGANNGGANNGGANNGGANNVTHTHTSFKCNNSNWFKSRVPILREAPFD